MLIRAFVPLLLAILILATPVAALEETMLIPVGKFDILAMLDAKGNAKADLIPGLDMYPEFAGLFKNAPEGVFRTFYFKDGGHNILVDAGWGEEQQPHGNTVALLEREGIAPAAITDLLITHLDWDHIGGLVKDGKPVFPNALLWISQPEYDAWLKGDLDKRPQQAKERARKLMDIYKGKIREFQFGEEILPGVTALDASGHTPGHTCYEIESGDDKMYIAGDIMHLAPVQLIRPELSSIYDIDPQKAAQSREDLLEKAANGKAIFAGMHMPTISPVRKRPDGGYMMREPR